MLVLMMQRLSLTFRVQLAEIVVPGDGNCFFSSIAYHVHDKDSTQHAQVRFRVSDWLRNNEGFVANVRREFVGSLRTRVDVVYRDGRKHCAPNWPWPIGTRTSRT